jgi:hypothetical protein
MSKQLEGKAQWSGEVAAVLGSHASGHEEHQEHTLSTQVPEKRPPEEFDLVILGGGTGGTIGAWTFASQGHRVLVIERKYVGGSCPNIACLPSKNIIHSAKVASYLRRSEEFGIARRDLPFTALR